MSKEKETAQSYTDMSEVPDMDDTVRILFWVKPEGEEVMVYEEEDRLKGYFHLVATSSRESGCGSLRMPSF